MKQAVVPKLQLAASMLIFSTIGLFTRWIPLPSGVIALVRGAVGAAFLLAVMLAGRRKPDVAAIRRKWWQLLLSGVCIGFNWILLFETYRYTTIATATLCYYLAPIFVILGAPLVTHERLTPRRLLCVGTALIGMLGVSGVLDGSLPTADEWTGIVCGLGAAVLYAAVVLLNTRLTDLPATDKTTGQLAVAAIALLPYCLLTGGLAELGTVSVTALLLLLVVGIVHTGVAYWLYFGALGRLKAQTAAIFSYIDPAAAILLSAVVLQEPLTVWAGVGAVLILGSALVSELPERHKTNA